MLAGLATSRKYEILNSEKVSLDEKKFVFRIIAAIPQRASRGIISLAPRGMPAPQCHGERCGGASVIVERHLRLHVESGRRGYRVRVGKPQTVEMIEPKRPIRAVASGNLIEVAYEATPKRVVLAFGALAVARLALLGFDWEQYRRRERLQGVSSTK